MVINFKYAFVIVSTLFVGWITVTPLSIEDKSRVKKLHEAFGKLTAEKDSLKKVTVSLAAEKELYLDSAKALNKRLAYADEIKEDLIDEYEKMLSDIDNMSADDHTSFYESRYADHDN